MATRVRYSLILRGITVALSVLIFAALPFVSSGQTRAQTSAAKLSLSVSPPLFEITMNPGESRSDVMKVINPSTDSSVPVTMSVEAFVGNETGEARIVDQGDPAYSLKDWVSVSPKSFTLKPQQSQDVTFTTKVPGDAEPGDRYGSVLASTDKTSLNQTGATTVQKVGSLVLLTITGDIKYGSNVKDFYPATTNDQIENMVRKSYFEAGPVSFFTRIHNSGTVHFKPTGFIAITNIFGKKVADIQFPTGNVLPASDRVFAAKWDNPPIGRYTATLVLNYGSSNDELSAATTFTVFPWKTGLPIIAGVIILLWFIIARRRNFGHAFKIIFSGKK